MLSSKNDGTNRWYHTTVSQTGSTGGVKRGIHKRWYQTTSNRAVKRWYQRLNQATVSYGGCSHINTSPKYTRWTYDAINRWYQTIWMATNTISNDGIKRSGWYQMLVSKRWSYQQDGIKRWYQKRWYRLAMSVSNKQAMRCQRNHVDVRPRLASFSARAKQISYHNASDAERMWTWIICRQTHILSRHTAKLLRFNASDRSPSRPYRSCRSSTVYHIAVVAISCCAGSV